MASLSSVSDFREWQTALKAALDPDKKEVTICCGTGCTGADRIRTRSIA